MGYKYGTTLWDKECADYGSSHPAGAYPMISYGLGMGIAHP